jgi:tyrosine-protein phosphatase OCA6
MDPGLLVIPPFRFATVEADSHVSAERESGLYRAAYPSLKNYRFLSLLNLKTIVSLVPNEPVRDLSEFCHTNDITHIHFRIDKFTEEVTFTPSVMTQILETIIDADNQPILLHCVDGANNTGLVVLCLRKLQNWDPAAALAEFGRFVTGEASSAHRQFLDGYRGDIVLPNSIPSWLWGGSNVIRHPSLNTRPARPIGTGSDVARDLEMGQQKSREQTATFLQALKLQSISTNRLGMPGPPQPDAPGDGSEHADEHVSLTISALALEGLDLG